MTFIPRVNGVRRLDANLYGFQRVRKAVTLRHPCRIVSVQQGCGWVPVSPQVAAIAARASSWLPGAGERSPVRSERSEGRTQRCQELDNVVSNQLCVAPRGAIGSVHACGHP